MHTSLSKRQNLILAYVREHGRATPDELASALAVSAPTIRRDLAALHEGRLIARFHGGVAHLTGILRPPFADRRAENHDLKHAIAREVVARIPAGSSVFLGTGTTMEQVAMLLPGDRALTVITPSIFCAASLVDRPGVELHVLGGRAIGAEGNISGIEPLRALESLKFDVAVMSFAGMDDDCTPMDFDVEHRPIKEAAIKNARRRIVAMDHTKFERGALVRVGKLADIDVLVTSASPTNRKVSVLRAAGIEIVTVEAARV